MATLQIIDPFTKMKTQHKIYKLKEGKRMVE